MVIGRETISCAASDFYVLRYDGSRMTESGLVNWFCAIQWSYDQSGSTSMALHDCSISIGDTVVLH